MDEQTERLRDIFVDVAEEDTVTESQAERRGTLADDAADVDERLAATIGDMRERYDFETDLPVETYVTLVRGFYGGLSDVELAADADLDEGTAFRARADLHLLRDDDAAAVDLGAVRDRIADGADPLAAAAADGAEREAAERAAAVIRAQDRSRRGSQRYRSRFEEALTDADLAVRLTADAREDGLAEATEDAEVDVDF